MVPRGTRPVGSAFVAAPFRVPYAPLRWGTGCAGLAFVASFKALEARNEVPSSTLVICTVFSSDLLDPKRYRAGAPLRAGRTRTARA